MKCYKPNTLLHFILDDNFYRVKVNGAELRIVSGQHDEPPGVVEEPAERDPDGGHQTSEELGPPQPQRQRARRTQGSRIQRT